MGADHVAVRRVGHGADHRSTLARVVGWMATATARLVGFDDRGEIAPGRRADLAVLAPDAGLRVDATRLRHRNPVTAYDGALLRGVVRDTYLAGVPVRDGDRRGALLARPRPVPAVPVPAVPVA